MEQRNRNWGFSRGRWKVSLKPTSDFAGDRLAWIDFIYALFLNVGGKADPFRFNDRKQNLGTLQSILPRGGGGLVYQLAKNYSIGGRTFTQTISKPIMSGVLDYQGNSLPDTVHIFVGGTEVTTGFAIDHTSGGITFDSDPGGDVTATFGFDYPARLDTDDLDMQLDPGDIGAWGSVDIVEVIPPNF
jgi:uncharacterized protein (TIGR02217 family)